MIRSFNHKDLADEWEEAFNVKLQKPINKNFNAIFSDDEDDQPQKTLPTLASGYTDPVLSTSTYHIHQADNALLSLKQIASEEEGWKKALKHKSGVMVHMKNGMHKGDKTPIFKGQAIIYGFSPQSIFYVIGMRKLWDDQYEDGSLIENLNDTTSLTYEVMKSTATSKSRDLALVEKIECTQNGVIIFACTSIETSKIPRISGRTRANIKLQGWILEPLGGNSQPSTKVTFVIQENLKGWVPSLIKKSLARRPLVIAKVEEYLEKKAERMRSQSNAGLGKRPSIMNLYPKTTTPPPRPINPPKAAIPTVLPQQEDTSTKPKSLYPLHTHPIQKVEGVQLLKKLTSSYDYWTLLNKTNDTQCYTFNAALENEMSRKLSFIRLDGTIHGSWTPEQLCSVIHCVGSRKIWDTHFEDGEVVERFSQKDYLVRWQFGGDPNVADTDIAAITTIETDPATSAVYTTAVSVNDTRILPDSAESRIRAHTDLYGWMFRPQLDSQGKTTSVETSLVCNMDFKYAVPTPILKDWQKSSVKVIGSIQAYLKRYGHPPYIRRVAGKVTSEAFDPHTSVYNLSYTVKHQPSRSYQSRKRQDAVWCTEIRFYQKMFPHGLDVCVLPDQHVRGEFKMNHQIIRIFTTHDSTEGQKLKLSLKPLENSAFDHMAYRFNGVLSPSFSKVETPVEQEKSQEALVASDEPINVPKGYLLIPEHQNNSIIFISDDLSFNGQQISVIFIVMVFCYYLGKFTSCHSC